MTRFLLSVALLAATASVALAADKLVGAIRTGTVACSARVVTISFDPRRGVEVRDGRGLLGSASFTNAELARTCRRVPEPTGYVDAGLGKEIRRALTVRCTAPTALRLHVNAITENGAGVGSNLLLGTGARLTVIASAVLKNKGDPSASRLYVAHRYCSLV